jgi:small subunit ribosomal protein S7
MPRRQRNIAPRDIGVDSRFQSNLVQRFINILMERGKKSVARSVVYGAFDVISKKLNNDEKKAFELFSKAMDQLIPQVEVRPRRVGGSVYQIPVEVPQRRAHSLALRWLIDAAASRTDKTMSDRLARELFDVIEGRGGAVKKKTDVQRMAEANRAFSHFAW